MNLYLLSQKVNNDYDTFDSCVVAAETPTSAKDIHPATLRYNIKPGDYDEKAWESHNTTWANSPADVKCIYIGVASASIKKECVICTSFNAG